jgi:hypothetical protein
MKATFLLPFTITSIIALAPVTVRAHCDTLDGPVVVTARAALESGKIEPVLAWVAPGDEAEIREAFARARSVRKGGKEARGLADRWFFETVVRVHRAGEGAAFTGLEPAGTPEPAIAAVDAVAAGGDAKRVEELLVRAVREGLHAHLARLSAEKPPASDVAAGRRWVAAYVPFVHWAEGVHAAAAGTGGHGSGHGADHAAEHETAAADGDAH